jgi:NADPH-dependent 2,4-dienoyl-CoA reductase/sulfur reductase-like enzyme
MLTGEEISEIGGKDAVEYVVFKGEKIPTELVILGTGVWPHVTLAESAGIKLAESGAIAVDNYMRTSASDVYAAGDCAEVPDFGTGRFSYSAVGSTGALAGAIAGVNAAGGNRKTEGFLRAQADEILGLQVYSMGHTTTTAKDVDLDVKVHDLPTPAEVESVCDEVQAKLLTDAKDRIVGAQAVAHRHGSQYAWQLYQAVLTGEPRSAFLKRWMSPRQRAAKLAREAGWGKLEIQTARKT